MLCIFQACSLSTIFHWYWLFVNMQKERAMLAMLSWRYPGLQSAFDCWICYVDDRNHFHREVVLENQYRKSTTQVIRTYIHNSRHSICPRSCSLVCLVLTHRFDLVPGGYSNCEGTTRESLQSRWNCRTWGNRITLTLPWDPKCRHLPPPLMYCIPRYE